MRPRWRSIRKERERWLSSPLMSLALSALSAMVAASSLTGCGFVTTDVPRTKTSAQDQLKQSENGSPKIISVRPSDSICFTNCSNCSYYLISGQELIY